MRWQFTDADLDAQARVRDAFDPDGVANPGKVLPEGSRCGDIQALSASAREKLLEEGAWV
jgi:glycolate oxidase